MATLRAGVGRIASSPQGERFLLSQEPTPAGTGEKPEAKSAGPSLGAMLGWSVGAILIVVIGLLIIIRKTSDPDFATGTLPSPVEGLTIFATFFVAAQAIERLLEPISSVLLPTTEKKDEAAKAADVAAGKVSLWAAAPQGEKDARKTAAEVALEAAAQAKAKVDQTHHHRVVTFWAIATIIAMAASALLKLYFLKQVGISSGFRWIEILATGLIIGAGTKPLHDLVTMISVKKEQAQASSNQTTV